MLSTKVDALILLKPISSIIFLAIDELFELDYKTPLEMDSHVPLHVGW